MLQIILETNDTYSLSEMAQMAIEGGCAWLQLNVAGLSDDELRLSVPEIVELCRENGTMLTVADHPELAKEFGLHGVLLHLGAVSPLQVREELGAEAVIGAEIGAAESAVSLAKADIDYVILSEDIDDASKTIAQTRAAGCNIPFVAVTDDFTIDNFRKLFAQGFDGICAAASIFSTHDPVAEINRISEQLPAIKSA